MKKLSGRVFEKQGQKKCHFSSHKPGKWSSMLVAKNRLFAFLFSFFHATRNGVSDIPLGSIPETTKKNVWFAVYERGKGGLRRVVSRASAIEFFFFHFFFEKCARRACVCTGGEDATIEKGERESGGINLRQRQRKRETNGECRSTDLPW